MEREEIRIEQVSIDKLIPYPNHQFPLYKEEAMNDFVENIKTNGMIYPIIVRPLDDVNFVILGGHNRVEAARKLEWNEVPSIIKENISDDEADLIVAASNSQRSIKELRPSELAFMLEHCLEMFKKLEGGQGKRNDLTTLSDCIDDKINLWSNDHRLKSRDKVAMLFSISPKKVSRYIQLTKLTREILNEVDAKNLSVTAANELSWLSENELTIISEVIKKYKICVGCAVLLREASEESEGKLTKDAIIEIIESMKDKSNNSWKEEFADELSIALSKYKLPYEEMYNVISDCLNRVNIR